MREIGVGVGYLARYGGLEAHHVYINTSPTLNWSQPWVLPPPSPLYKRGT